MENITLSILPPVHATILSIVVAFSTVLFLNAHQEILKSQTRLSNSSRQIADIMNLSVYSLHEDEKYTIGKSSDIETQLHRDFIKIINMYQYLDLERFTGRKYEEEKYSENEVIDAMADFISIISHIATKYPYYGAKQGESTSDIRHNEIDAKWFEDLVRLNTFYIQQYESRKLGIDDLIKKYRAISANRRKTVIEKGWYSEKMSEGGTIIGQYTKEGDDLFRNGKVDIVPTVDRTKVIPEFFSKLLYLQRNIIPQVSDSVHSLKYNEKKFKIKIHSMVIILTAIFLVTFGIIIPLYLLTFKQVPILVEHILLFITMLPYIGGLFYLLKIVSYLKIP